MFLLAVIVNGSVPPIDNWPAEYAVMHP